MRTLPPLRAALVFVLLTVSHPWAAAGQAHRRPLDHDDFEKWRAIREETLSPDGRWVAYVLSSRNGARLRVQALPAGPTLDLPRGHGAQFTHDGRFVVATVDAVGGMIGSRAPDTLAVVDLERLAADPSAAPRAVERVAGLLSLQIAERGPNRIAYRLGLAGPEGVLVVRTLGTADELRVRDVSEYRLSPDGERVWYVRDDAHGSEDGVYRLETASGAVTPLMVQEGMYTGLAVSRDAARAAFLFAPVSSAVPAWRLFAVVEDRARMLVSDGAPELEPGWRVRRDAPLRFSDSGARLFFGTVPNSPEMTEDDDQGVTVDVWSWNDPYLQPMQLARAEVERERTYHAVARLESGAVVQLEHPGGPDLVEPRSGDEPALLALTDEPYRQLLSWDARYTDAYLVDGETGASRRVLEKVRGDATLSPTGRWVTWWDGTAGSWKVMDAATGNVVALTASVPFPVKDEQHDRPGPADPYGWAGWTPGDAHALVYDRYDVWRVDPRGLEPAVSVTLGAGRREGVRLRLAAPARDGVVPGTSRLLLAALDLDSYASGFWATQAEGQPEPRALLMSPHRYGVPQVAASADRVLLTRESFSEYPDLWVGGGDLQGLARVTEVNPQQTEFAWGTEELVSWTSRDGTPLKGILYKPQGFDPAKKYPLIVHLYERATDDFHLYHDPAPGSASINRSFYVSRGYVVFAPDIVYRVGEPGASVEDAVIPGVEALVAAGYVDRARIGVQGHSWGGWEAAHLVTRTDLFTAAIAGAPVANMTSAYGGVRWGSGMSRMFQYESEQSRIGATLWETPERYIQNSPLFGADRVKTPLLLLHNDEDTAVPFEQGIELFSALRRLGKPAWMVNYNGELHGIRRAANRRDWAIRMQQFFDHYLLGEPAPVWLVQGIPAREKGRTLGLELTEPEAPQPATDFAR